MVSDAPKALGASLMAVQMRFLTYKGFMWAVGIVAFVYAVGSVPIQEAWAALTWQRIPCQVVSEKRFFFEWNGRQYYGARKNLWANRREDPLPADEKLKSVVPDAVCYVQVGRDGAIGSGVLRLDAHRQPKELAGRVFVGTMILGAIWLVTRTRKKAKKRAVPAREGGS